MPVLSHLPRTLLAAAVVLVFSAAGCASIEEVYIGMNDGPPLLKDECRTARDMIKKRLKKKTNSVGMEFVYIEPGVFQMGSPVHELQRFSNEHLHEVTISTGFYLQTTEVTQKQWLAVMGTRPSHFMGCGEECPVENISWEQANEFIRKLNEMENTDKYRLPTEAEWEYACRAGTETPFAFGKCLSTKNANYDGRYPLSVDMAAQVREIDPEHLYRCPKGKFRGEPIPVGRLAPNAWGLYDMHGNVMEYCADVYGPYPRGAVTDPAGPLPLPGDQRVTRGGSWASDARYCRSAARKAVHPASASYLRGFRVLMEK
ncbi:MAG: formylglycine-generating enzyme family protein [Deltaproteobacteria bacterium]|nr:formylglycine-generating enzyme family protein [Deltaproteobacteria bacterium]